MKKRLFFILTAFAVLIFISSCGTSKKVLTTPEKKVSKIKKSGKKETETFSDLDKVLNAWIGTPYKWGGTTHKGVDCSGFVIAVFKEYYRYDIPVRKAVDIMKFSEKIKQKELQKGDLLFYTLPKPSDIHVGIYLSDGNFIHATTKKGVMINSMDQPYYKNSFHSAGRIKIK